MIRFLGLLLLSLSLAGCVSKYRVDNYEKPSVHLNRTSSFYVTLPADGQYGDTAYPGSGAAAAHAVRAALLTHVDKVVTGAVANESLESALAQAKQQGLSHVFQTSILNWEDRATEWSGIPDKITLKLAVYNAQSGEMVSSTITSASSKWGTFGGDHPQDLLPVPTKTFADQLF